MSETFKDRFGRTVTYARVGNWDVYAISGFGWEAQLTWPAGQRTRQEAIGTIESHIPDGRVEPAPDEAVPP